jgi:hypothetical protein
MDVATDSRQVTAKNPGGGPESRLWAAVVERGQEARTARPTKNTPHPVGFLLTALKFVAYLAVDAVLSVQESLQVVGIGGHRQGV